MLENGSSLQFVPALLSNDDCDKLVERSRVVGMRPAAQREAGRHNEEAFIDSPELRALLKSRLIDVAGAAPDVRVQKMLEFYRYGRGDFVTPHCDTASMLAPAAPSFYSLLIYLNDGYRGRRTVFPELSVAIRGRKGDALIFEHRLLHEGGEVLHREKFVLRSSIGRISANAPLS